MKIQSLFLAVLITTYATFAPAQTPTEGAFARILVPTKHNSHQGLDGTCYAYVATDYLNSVAGLMGKMRLRPRSSLVLLSLNESSPFLDFMVKRKFGMNASSIFDGGWTDSLLGFYAKNTESLIPVSPELESVLSYVVPFFEKPQSANDQVRIRDLMARDLYKKLKKAEKSWSMKTEAIPYIQQLSQMGLTMDDANKKMKYTKPQHLQPQSVEQILKAKKMGNMSTMYFDFFEVDKCVEVAQQIIFASIQRGHPVSIGVKMDKYSYHALLIYQIVYRNSEYKLKMKNSWTDSPVMTDTLHNLCRKNSGTRIDYLSNILFPTF